MKSNPTAFLFIVVVLRLAALYLILSSVYSLLSAIFTLQMGMGWGVSGFILVQLLRPIAAAIVLWLLARPIGRLVLRDFDNTPG
jgi:predicted cobalt transporter CbtA